MRIPEKPKPLIELIAEIREEQGIERVAEIAMTGGLNAAPNGKYLHWDELRHRTPPEGIGHKEWWCATKLARQVITQPLPFSDTRGKPFRFAMADPVLSKIHGIDRDASGRIEISEEVTNPSTRDRYIVNSLIEEAITSSQLEGASTTRRVAADMIRSGRRPKDRSEQMILNNFEAMRFLRKFTGKPLSPTNILELHKIVTDATLDDPAAAGRLRTPSEDDIRVVDHQGNVLHVPPPSHLLADRLAAICDFANGKPTDRFIHPVVRAIVLHFWLAYDHPFVDGNGRSARALFYWSMLSQGYWLCEYISISRILRAAPARYARSYLYTETDENDVTYFILYQLGVIRRAIDELNKYLKRKVEEVRQTEQLIRRSAEFNHRQIALLAHAMKHPHHRYSIESHRTSHNVVYQTARTDLLDLVSKGLLEQRKTGRSFSFYPADNFVERLQGIDE